MLNQISKSRGTLGVSHTTDGEYCHIHRLRSQVGYLRVNIDGIWTVLCGDCVEDLIGMLNNPSVG